MLKGFLIIYFTCSFLFVISFLYTLIQVRSTNILLYIFGSIFLVFSGPFGRSFYRRIRQDLKNENIQKKLNILNKENINYVNVALFKAGINPWITDNIDTFVYLLFKLDRPSSKEAIFLYKNIKKITALWAIRYNNEIYCYSTYKIVTSSVFLNKIVKHLQSIPEVEKVLSRYL